MISGYAQTNIQLYRQLAELGYPSTDVSRVHRGHGLAMKLFTGLFRGSGRPILAHLVGTASVLASVRAPIEEVTAGLLHSAYSHGEFGNYWRGPDQAKRAQVVAAVGPEVEALVLGYTRLPWTAKTIGALADTAAASKDREATTDSRDKAIHESVDKTSRDSNDKQSNDRQSNDGQSNDTPSPDTPSPDA